MIPVVENQGIIGRVRQIDTRCSESLIGYGRISVWRGENGQHDSSTSLSEKLGLKLQ